MSALSSSSSSSSSSSPSQQSRVLSLLSGPTDNHILAALSVLPNLNPPPPPATVVKSLGSKGIRFVDRLVTTGIKDPAEKAAYIDVALQCYSYLLSEPIDNIADDNIDDTNKTSPGSSSSSSSTPPSSTFNNTLLIHQAAPSAFFNVAAVISPANAKAVSSLSTKTLALSLLARLLSLPAPPKLPLEQLFDSAKPLLVLSKVDEVSSSETKACALAANALLLNLPSLTFQQSLVFLTLSTDLSSSLQHLAVSLEKPSFREDFDASPPLQKTARRLLTSALKNSDYSDLDDDSLASSSASSSKSITSKSIKPLALTLISRLLSSSGSWATDPSNSSQALGVFVRVACGELRITLSHLLSALERDSPPSQIEETFPLLAPLSSIFLDSTRYLLEIMDDDEESAAAAAWSRLPFESLIHIKGSLDDAVDAVTQLLADDAVLKLAGAAPAHLKEAVAGLLRPLGCWLAENEMDESL